MLFANDIYHGGTKYDINNKKLKSFNNYVLLYVNADIL